MGEESERLAVLSNEYERLSKLNDEYHNRLRTIEEKINTINPNVERLENGFKIHDKILVRGNGQASIQEQIRSHRAELNEHISKIRKLEDGYVDMNATITKFGLFAERFDETINRFSDILERFDKTVGELKNFTEKVGNKVEDNSSDITTIKNDVIQMNQKISDVDNKGKIDSVVFIKQNLPKILIYGGGALYFVMTIKPVTDWIMSLIK